MTFGSIRNALKDLLETETSIQKVYKTEVSELEGFPAAVLSIGGNEAAFGSTATDRVTFLFTLRIYYPLKSADVQETEEEALQDCADEVLNLLRRRPLASLDGWIEPVMTDPFIAVMNGDSVLYMATMKLRFVCYPVQQNG